MIRKLIAAGCVAVMITACSSGQDNQQASDANTTVDPAQEAAITKIIQAEIPKLGLESVIVNVRRGGETVIRQSFGSSQTNVPATTDMHFRNGAVAISYMANLLLQYVDAGQARLTDRVSQWLPDLPHANQVTLQQLAQMTSGYQDYVQDPKILAILNRDPFGFISTEQQLTAAAKPLSYKPGTNWSYAHTNYVILGQVLEKIGGKPLNELMQEKVLDPLGLTGTTANDNAPIPEPTLHAYSSERRGYFKIPKNQKFIEESTYWNPSWTLAHGAIQTTTIDDLATTAEAIGTGKLLSEQSFKQMTSTSLRGFGAPKDGCPTCMKQTDAYAYGLGIVTSGNWLFQNPMFAGYAAFMSYLPPQQVSISIATTMNDEAFNSEGMAPNTATELFTKIAEVVTPDDLPPPRS